ncbi:hypothetical protein SNL152K_10404 [Streptomyces sp. NL15-2K]|nr:hypothetical protein SNL152K_10404 [Streptomyces sp. NL15-2K]
MWAARQRSVTARSTTLRASAGLHGRSCPRRCAAVGSRADSVLCSSHIPELPDR